MQQLGEELGVSQDGWAPTKGMYELPLPDVFQPSSSSSATGLSLAEKQVRDELEALRQLHAKTVEELGNLSASLSPGNQADSDEILQLQAALRETLSDRDRCKKELTDDCGRLQTELADALAQSQ